MNGRKQHDNGGRLCLASQPASQPVGELTSLSRACEGQLGSGQNETGSHWAEPECVCGRAGKFDRAPPSNNGFNGKNFSFFQNLTN